MTKFEPLSKLFILIQDIPHYTPVTLLLCCDNIKDWSNEINIVSTHVKKQALLVAGNYQLYISKFDKIRELSYHSKTCCQYRNKNVLSNLAIDLIIQIFSKPHKI